MKASSPSKIFHNPHWIHFAKMKKAMPKKNEVVAKRDIDTKKEKQRETELE